VIRFSSARVLALFLAAVLVLDVLVFLGGRRTDEELHTAAQVGTPEERALALHVLANRGDTILLGEADLEALTSSGSDLLVEFAMTHDLARGDAAEAQRAWVEAHPERERARFFLEHQVRRMLRRDLAAYFAAD
jgi:hypothetical protein